MPPKGIVKSPRKRPQRGRAEGGKSKEPLPPSSMVTRSATRARARNAVFLPAEILEQILLYLPMKDILLDQRVGYQWWQVISKSQKLQQALFMLPREAESGWMVTVKDRSICDIEPADLTKGKEPVVEENAILIRHGEFNPFWFTQEGSYADFWDLMRGRDGAIFFLKERWWRSRNRRPWMDRPEASWRKMLIIQPPVQSFDWEWTTHKDVEAPDRGVLTSEQNITVGDVVREMGKIEDEDDEDLFFVEHYMQIPFGIICASDINRAGVDSWRAAQKAKLARESEDNGDDDDDEEAMDTGS